MAISKSSKPRLRRTTALRTASYAGEGEGEGESEGEGEGAG
jgi:hypothetical protein